MLYIWHNDCHADKRMSIRCIGHTLFKILQSLAEPTNLLTWILHVAMSKFYIISALQYWLLLSWVERFRKTSLMTQFSWAGNLLSDTRSFSASTQSSTPDFSIKALSLIEPEKHHNSFLKILPIQRRSNKQCFFHGLT